MDDIIAKVKENIQMDLSDAEYNKTTVMYMTGFFLFYSIIYRVLRWTISKRPPEYVCRLLTFGHGLFCSLSCLHYITGPALGFNKGKLKRTKDYCELHVTTLPRKLFVK